MQNDWKFKGKHDYTKILARGCKEIVSRCHIHSKVRGDLQCNLGNEKAWF